MADSNLKPDTLYEGIAHQRTSTSLMELLSNLYAYSLAAVSEGAWTPSTRGKIPTFDALQEQLIDCIEMESIILRKLVKGHILD